MCPVRVQEDGATHEWTALTSPPPSLTIHHTPIGLPGTTPTTEGERGRSHSNIYLRPKKCNGQSHYGSYATALGHLLNPLPHTSHPHTLTPSQEGNHWVSFHFQQSRDELVWVTVVGKAAIFLALCLHSAVDELLWQHSNKLIRKPSENVSKGRTRLVYAVHQTLPSLAEVGLACKTR